MLGWFADLFRFAWGLLYWNTRKSLFRLRRGHAACPCQSPSDSGRAFETHCEACMTWDKPERFRRVCPLLVRTEDGLRCSVNTEDVRPFWGVPVRYYGGAFLAIYAAVVITIFSILRSVGYPVSIVHVGFPPLWHKVGQARGWFFSMRAQQAFAAGRANEGFLYLANAFEFDPSNYETGAALAKAFQLGRPGHSDQIYAKLLVTHPQHRTRTAVQWFRALLARGDFEKIEELAAEQIVQEPQYANVWMRALVFASHQTGNEKSFKKLLANTSVAARAWQPLLETELLIHARKLKEARAALVGAWPRNGPPFMILYRVDALLLLGDPMAALDLLVANRSHLDAEAYLTYRLDCLGHAGATQSLRNEFQASLLDQPLTQPTLKIMCAQLIRHPDRVLFDRLVAKLAREPIPFNDDTAGGWFSLLCTAGTVGDIPQLKAIILQLRKAAPVPFHTLTVVEAFFESGSTDKRASSFLPVLPMSTEVTYALIEKYSGARTPWHPSGK